MRARLAARWKIDDTELSTIEMMLDRQDDAGPPDRSEPRARALGRVAA